MPPPIIPIQLIEKIKSAFSGNHYPGDENLVNQSYGEEPELIRKHFTGRQDWSILSDEFLDLDGALSFFSDAAFRFYLPAFMIADIREKLAFNDPAVRLCWALTPQSENQKIAAEWGGGTMGERARTSFDQFSKEQTEAIVSYLSLRLTRDVYSPTIGQALEHYWLKRLKDSL